MLLFSFQSKGVQGNKRVIYGSTSLFNAKQFLKQVRQFQNELKPPAYCLLCLFVCSCHSLVRKSIDYQHKSPFHLNNTDCSCAVNASKFHCKLIFNCSTGFTLMNYLHPLSPVAYLCKNFIKMCVISTL